MTPEDLQSYLTGRLDDHVVSAEVDHGHLTLTLDAEGYVEAARLASDSRLACDFYDCTFGVDERDEGFSVVTVLYSTRFGHRVILKHLCAGGREQPVAPTLTHLYRGADWMERETWDMFGIEFEGHPGLAPRILTTENFEGWPLRKDFWLATREAKPWPGLKEPLELDDEGKPLAKAPAGPGAAPGPSVLDELMADAAKRAAGQEAGEAEVAEEAGATEAGATEAPGEDEAEDEAKAEQARERAEGARKEAAEARAKKAAERAAEERGADDPGSES